MGKIFYYEGNYKYQLGADYVHQLGFSFGGSLVQKALDSFIVENEFISLTRSGILTLKKGYACDGPSGPTIDTPDSIRAAFVHDAGYQLIREGQLPLEYKEPFDQEFYHILLEDGMLQYRAFAWYQAVRKFGISAATGKPRELLCAPRVYKISQPPALFGRV